MGDGGGASRERVRVRGANGRGRGGGGGGGGGAAHQNAKKKPHTVASTDMRQNFWTTSGPNSAWPPEPWRTNDGFIMLTRPRDLRGKGAALWLGVAVVEG